MPSAKLWIIAMIVLAAVVVVVFVATAVAVRRRRYHARLERFKRRWKEVQHACAKEDTWPKAVLDADKLVDDALKTSGFKGRTMGERLVSAQRSLSDNDSVWFGHKLSNKIASDQMKRPIKKDVLEALRGLRQALVDLGVLS